MKLSRLEPHAPPPERDLRPPEEYQAMQALTKELAFDPATWTADRRARVRQLFDGLAPEWHTRDTEERRVPVCDALERGGVPRGGTCLEVGSGIGSYTGDLLRCFDRVLSVDLSMEMLRLATERPAAARITGDASSLPLRDSTVDAVVCINAYLFPREYARVLKSPGSVVFVSTIGDQTPIYLPPEDVIGALEPHLGELEAATADAGPGRWTAVVRRSTRQV